MAAAYINHLLKDKKLARVLNEQEAFVLTRKENLFLSICSSIVSQQLSTKVAQVIYKRFLGLFDVEEPSPEHVLSTSIETLRSIGLSNAKAAYVRNVAQFAIDRGINIHQLDQKTDEEIIQYLTEIKGVGRWTVEMLLMFTFAREDVFAPDDLGIQNAMIRLYKLSRDDKNALRANMLRISSKWKPYRTYACLHLWHWKDNKPLQVS